VEQIKIDLTAHEYEGLAHLAEQDLRNMGNQVRYLIRQELQRRGLVEQPAAPVKESTNGR
jgi:hypothetical protein